MRATVRGKISLLFMAFALMLAIPAVALADTVYNNLDATIDAPAESITLTEGGTNDTASVLISPTNGDGKNGCNLTSNTTLQVKANSSDAAKVKASLVDPTNTSLAKDTFTSCGDSIKVKVEALAVTGSTPVTISLSQVANNTGGTFNLAPATFTVTVNAAPVTNTKPALTLPANITEEATGASGAAVSYTATANDKEDGALTPDCKPVSGSTFPVGTTTVNCSVTDSGNLSASGSFTVEVTPQVDRAAPVFSNVPADITEEATGSAGASVTYTEPTANDNVDGSVQVKCLPASGSTFALGTTKVDCSATDAAGNTASASFNVTVQDKTGPELALPNNITEEATGPNGAPVNFTVTSSDLVDGSVAVSCSPDSGTFALGTTTVNCSATDKAGNKSEGSFNVTVKDTTAPKLTLPDNITEEATGPDGNKVTYSASSSDLVDGSVSVSCTPNSGSTFAIDTTTVNCEATDAAKNKATGSFTVKVQDTTAPTNVQFDGNISDGGSFFFGDVPAQPTCTADDSGSGLQGCVVTGYKTAVGTHTLTATATDKAGNESTKTLSYTVKPYTFKGFYQPVDMGGVYNTVKGGSTVPLKFELFKGDTELTSTSYINQPLQTQKVSCTSGATEDTIELLATGGTSLRYDSTGGQFIYNWKTPAGAGSCYKVTVSATDGSSSITAYFKMK